MFPTTRFRRLRRSAAVRGLVRETRLHAEQFVYPLFVRPGEGVREPIAAMPGNFRWSPDRVVDEIGAARDEGVRAFLLFGIPERKDATGSEAWDDDATLQHAVRTIRAAFDDVAILTDVCLCEYTDHGHCGVVRDGDVDNDATLELLARTARSHARAGADLVAPSDMMDGRVGAIRAALDADGFERVGILSYAVKYASAFYGPFREAAGSAPSFGDRRSYQMDPPNVREGVREARADVDEGADAVMVKPALAYLDVIRAVREAVDVPVAAYNVSGEFSMLAAAVERGWADRERAVLEVLTAIRRAGADCILTYHAREAARALAAGA